MRTGRIILTLIAGLVLLLSSCEGNTKREWIITNNSSFEVSIEADSTFAPLYVNTIPPGQTITVMISNARGGQSVAGSASDNLNWLIYNEEDTLKKNPNLDANWAVMSEHEKKVPSQYAHSFEFEFTDADF